MPSCSRFFENNANKIALTEFLSSYYLMQGTTVPENKRLCLAGGFTDGTQVKKSMHPVQQASFHSRVVLQFD